jgi:hypothetical protein
MRDGKRLRKDGSILGYWSNLPSMAAPTNKAIWR